MHLSSQSMQASVVMYCTMCSGSFEAFFSWFCWVGKWVTLAVQHLKPHNESLGSHSKVIVFKNAKIVFQDVLKEASPFLSPHVENRLVSWEGCPLKSKKKGGGGECRCHCWSVPPGCTQSAPSGVLTHLYLMPIKCVIMASSIYTHVLFIWISKDGLTSRCTECGFA